jgi:two-component system, LytTR family, response regulator
LNEKICSMIIKAIIVDDEKNGRENLSGLLKTYCPRVNIVGEANSVRSAIELIGRHNPDLIFLDIEMPVADGFALLEHFKEYPFEVIFVTAYDSYAIKAIRFSAADYILKPISTDDLKHAVDIVFERIIRKQENDRLKQLYRNIQQPNDPRIGLAIGESIEFVDVNTIVRCQGEGNYTHIFFENRKPLLVSKSLVEFEDLLVEYSFIRVHKAHLVNLKKVSAFTKTDGGILRMSNSDSVPISRRRKEAVAERLRIK